MIIVQICVGSSCHLNGSEKIVNLFRKEISERKLEDEVVLTGSFCFGKCNRTGVTVSFDDNVIVGVTPENFSSVFKEHILSKIHNT
ncbi:MAG: (2Fe-2S) ferredoxin domain-containing protein [Eubacteriales bacterium]